MTSQQKTAITERIIGYKPDKLDLFLAALRQAEIQDLADRVREYLFSARRATQRIKGLNYENLRISNTLGTRKFSPAQRAVFEDLIKANRAECRELVSIRRGSDRPRQVVSLARVAQDVMREQPKIALEDWPYEIGRVLAWVDDIKVTTNPQFIKRVRSLFGSISSRRKLSNEERDFLVVLAALYRRLS